MNTQAGKSQMRLIVLPGDGIGPEITAATCAVLAALDQRHGLGLSLEEHTVGLASLERQGSTLPDAVVQACEGADGVVLGPVSHLHYPPRDQGGLNPSGDLRIQLDLFANIRPSRSRAGLPPWGLSLIHIYALHALRDAGHEIAARGMDLSPLPSLGAGERAALQACREVLTRITGTAPVGFRAPGGELSSQTLGHLADLGFGYDSSFQDDDFPYLLAPGADTRLVEIPTVHALDDSLPFSARHTHARVFQIWREEFDALHAEGCLVPLTVHLRGDVGSTRAARIAALEALLEHMAAQPGVCFMTGAQLAAHVRAANLPAEENPVSVHLPTLAVTPYRGDLSVKPL